MAWKTFVDPLAMIPRRRVVTSSLIYGLSLTIRLTTSTGEEAEKPAQTAQDSTPSLSIIVSDDIQALNDRPLTSAQPIIFHRDRPLVPRICRAECERPMQLASMLDCSPP